jgi:hypothetical protein
MLTPPDITVVTCIYNKGLRTERTMQSILAQTCPSWRYIVINDGSTDNTREILSKYNDPRVQIRHQANRGFCVTMADVMREVTTPFVAIQGAGDISVSTRLSIQRTFLLANPNVSAVGCVVDVTDSDGRLVRKGLRLRRAVTSPLQLLRGNIASHGEIMMRMDAYRRAGGYRGFFKYAQDYDLWLRLSREGVIVSLEKQLYQQVVDLHGDISSDADKLLIQAQFGGFARYLAETQNAVSRKLTEDALPEEFAAYCQNAPTNHRKRWARRVSSAARTLPSDHPSLGRRLQNTRKVLGCTGCLSASHVDIYIRSVLIIFGSKVLNIYSWLFAAGNHSRRLLSIKKRIYSLSE